MATDFHVVVMHQQAATRGTWLKACYKCSVSARSAMWDKAKIDAMCVLALAGGGCVSVCTLQEAAGNADDVQLRAALTRVPHRCLGA